MKKKIISVLVLLCLMSVIFAGCTAEDSKIVKVYYLDIKKSTLITKDYELTANDTNGYVVELINVLSKDTNSPEYLKPIPAAVSLKDFYVRGGLLVLNFSKQYEEIDPIEEILVRAAIANTMLQIPGVEEVSFQVAGQPLVDSAGNVVSAMTKETFLNYNDNSKDALTKQKVNLYYSTEDGTALIKEEHEIYYDSRVLVASVVMDYLRKKPESKNAKVAIPSSTKVVSTLMSDGVCYVTLDSTLQNQLSDVSKNVIIYSIVNSLCDLDNVNTVVIKVENDNSSVEQNNLDIAGTYQKDYSLVLETHKQEEQDAFE